MIWNPETHTDWPHGWEPYVAAAPQEPLGGTNPPCATYLLMCLAHPLRFYRPKGGPPRPQVFRF